LRRFLRFWDTYGYYLRFCLGLWLAVFGPYLFWGILLVIAGR